MQEGKHAFHQGMLWTDGCLQCDRSLSFRKHQSFYHQRYSDPHKKTHQLNDVPFYKRSVFEYMLLISHVTGLDLLLSCNYNLTIATTISCAFADPPSNKLLPLILWLYSDKKKIHISKLTANVHQIHFYNMSFNLITVVLIKYSWSIGDFCSEGNSEAKSLTYLKLV